jgi:hypothetical protein
MPLRWSLPSTFLLAALIAYVGVTTCRNATPLLSAPRHDAPALHSIDDDSRAFSVGNLDGLERAVAATPDATSTARLVGAYLDRGEPGLAMAALDHARPEVRVVAALATLEARTLFARGRARQALAAAERASQACADDGCAAWVLASATRQVAFLEQVVADGIEDPTTAPDRVQAAYERSARTVRLVAMR